MDPFTTDKTNAPFEVRVKKVQKSGLLVACPEGAEGWLPADEWSYDQAAWKRDQSGISPGKFIKVVRWGKAIYEGQIPLSLRRVERNPWDGVSETWKGQAKYFQVNRLTRDWAVGEIEPGLQAKLELKTFDGYIKEKSNKDIWRTHTWIALGDWVGGIVKEISYPDQCYEPEFVLDSRTLFDKLEKTPEFLVGQVQLVSPHDLHAGSLHFDMHDRAPNVDHIFLLDNDAKFLNAVADALEYSGYRLTKAGSKENALNEIQSLPHDSIDVALIDVHLLEDLIVHDGLEVAREMVKKCPHCKIILISAETIGQENENQVHSKIDDAKDLKVAAYLEKPLTLSQLHREMALAATRPARGLKEIFAPLIEEADTVVDAEATLVQHTGADVFDTHLPIKEIIDQLGRQLQGVVVHIFQMHPLKKQGKSIAHYGEGLSWRRYRHKLAKSPVRDTAIDSNRTAWVHDDVDSNAHLQGMHFWLRRAMNYRSALGIPIKTDSLMNYCLLAFHSEAGRFTAEFFEKAKLCAEQAGRALEWEWLMTQTNERARFETAGMAFACLGHELRSDLTALSADILMLEEWLQEAAQGGTLPAASLEKAAALRLGIERAITVSQTFRGVQSRAAPRKVNVLECLDEAILAAKTQLTQEKEIRVQKVAYDAQTYTVLADRSGLMLALFNLLLNSIQQMTLYIRPKGIVWVQCEYRKEADGDWIKININDTGPGIHPADFERVFKVGYSTRPDGTGMGLHICRQVISSIRDGQRKGEVRVSSSVLGIGTTFTVRLPIVDNG